jgi:valyl-tRNA synthetase
MGDFQFGEAQRQIHDFLWGEFCDWYIELAKIRLFSTAEPSPLPVLVHVLETALRLLHPYMPFITEELWQNIKKGLPPGRQATDSIIIAAYPEADASAIDPDSERVIATVIEIIHSIRNIRAQYKVDTARQIEAQVYAGELKATVAQYAPAIQALARARLTILDKRPSKSVKDALVTVLKETEVVIPMASMFDPEAEKKRIGKEMEELNAGITRLEQRLKDEAFLSRAPAAIIEKERARLADRKDKLKRLKHSRP